MTALLPLTALYGANLTDATLRCRVIEAGLRGDENAFRIMRETVEYPTSPSTLSLLSDLVDRGQGPERSQGSRRILARLARERDVLPVIVRLLEESSAHALFRRHIVTQAPDPLHPDDGAIDPEGASRSRQTLFEEFPPEVGAQVLDLIRRSLAERSEFASLSGRMGDVPLPPTPTLTSHEARQVDTDLAYVDFAVRDLYERMIQALEGDAGLAGGRAAVHILHTHPLGFGNHRDGRYYTHLSLGDLHVANRYARVFSERLRSAGFTGGLDVFMGALPVPFRPLGENLWERLYVATYHREIL